VGDPIDFRRAEVGRRAALESKADKFVQLARGALDDWNKSKPWLNETERADFGKQVPKLTRSGPQAAWKLCWVCGASLSRATAAYACRAGSAIAVLGNSRLFPHAISAMAAAIPQSSLCEL